MSYGPGFFLIANRFADDPVCHITQLHAHDAREAVMKARAIIKSVRKDGVYPTPWHRYVLIDGSITNNGIPIETCARIKFNEKGAAFFDDITINKKRG